MSFRDIEEQFESIKDELDEARQVDLCRQVHALEIMVWDALRAELQCLICGDSLNLLCPDCREHEDQKARDRREEVERALAATNGTL